MQCSRLWTRFSNKRRVFSAERNDGQFNLFAAECTPGQQSSFADIPIPALPEWEDLTKLSYEKDLMGFYVTGHPLMKYEDVIKTFTNASAASLGQMPVSSQVRIAGLVKKMKEITTKKGDRMAFVELEDLSGTTEITVFSDLYLPNRELLQSTDPLIVTGTKEGENDAPKILAQEIHPLDEAPRLFSRGIRIRISARRADPGQIKDLKRILTLHKGRTPVKLHVVIPNRTETVISLGSLACDVSKDLVEQVCGTFGDQAVAFE